MFITKKLQEAKGIYQEYPRQFWIITMSRFIDQVGGALLFPFITLYITQKFDVGMTQVGVIFGEVAIFSVVGTILGGALTDRFGRKGMVIFGLLASAFINMTLGLVNRIEWVYLGAPFIGLFANAAGPAHGAMVADILPEEKRAQGYGIMRVVFNLAVVIGPAIGGLLAVRSYLLLFIADAVTSTITAIIVAVAIKESKPELAEGEEEQTVAETIGGYRDVLRDVTFLLFIGAFILLSLVYMNMNTTLGVYLRDTHGIPERGFGYLLSMNAAMVVLLQFPITRRIAKYRPMTMMTVGTVLYAIGFGMYGFVSTYLFFVVAMVIITIGEMLVAPNSQALAASFAPEDMRGRYMAMFGFSGLIPTAIGPLLAGIVMDNLDQRWLWYAAGILGLAAAGAFSLLQRRVERTDEEETQPADVVAVA
jgi:MFS family permease